MLQVMGDLLDVDVGTHPVPRKVWQGYSVKVVIPHKELSKLGKIHALEGWHAHRRRYVLVHLCEFRKELVEGCVFKWNYAVSALMSTFEESTRMLASLVLQR